MTIKTVTTKKMAQPKWTNNLNNHEWSKWYKKNHEWSKDHWPKHRQPTTREGLCKPKTNVKWGVKKAWQHQHDHDWSTSTAMTTSTRITSETHMELVLGEDDHIITTWRDQQARNVGLAVKRKGRSTWMGGSSASDGMADDKTMMGK